MLEFVDRIYNQCNIISATNSISVTATVKCKTKLFPCLHKWQFVIDKPVLLQNIRCERNRVKVVKPNSSGKLRFVKRLATCTPYKSLFFKLVIPINSSDLYDSVFLDT